MYSVLNEISIVMFICVGCIPLLSVMHSWDIRSSGAGSLLTHGIVFEGMVSKSCMYSRRAEEGLKSCQINHADISITGCLLP